VQHALHDEFEESSGARLLRVEIDASARGRGGEDRRLQAAIGLQPQESSMPSVDVSQEGIVDFERARLGSADDLEFEDGVGSVDVSIDTERAGKRVAGSAGGGDPQVLEGMREDALLGRTKLVPCDRRIAIAIEANRDLEVAEREGPSGLGRAPAAGRSRGGHRSHHGLSQRSDR
jgi:hypothetical protein